MDSSTFFSTWAPRVLSLMRFVVAFLFTAHGSQKLLRFPLGPEARPAPEFMTLNWVGAVLELFGGLLLMLGLFTRPVAFILSGMMAVAYFMVHAKGGFWPILNHGEPAAVYCWVFLYLAAAGGGPWSLDALIARNKPA